MKQRLSIILVAALALSFFSSVALARTWYIKPDGTGDVPTIQAGIDTAEVGDVVLVAAGSYTWTNQGTGDEYGLIRFWGHVTGFELRSESGAGATILDAEGQGRVIYLMGYNEVVIDGFTITGGVAPSFGYYQGGGILAHLTSPTIRNCIIRGNSAECGGGVQFNGYCAPVFEDCSIINNIADNGGGICLAASLDLMTFIRCVIKYNSVTGKGGGVYVDRVPFWFVDCSISANYAGAEGGALYGREIRPSVILGNTMSENISPVGGGIRLVTSSSCVIKNTIIAYNGTGGGVSLGSGSTISVEACDLFGNTGGDSWPSGTTDLGGNFSLNPEFCGTLGSYYYRLQASSPCAPGNHPSGLVYGLIGAFPVSCDVPAKQTTWGGIKALYKE